MSKRWKIFAVLALMYVLAYFYRVSMAVVAKDLSRELGLDATRLGTLSSLFFYVYAFAQIPLGPLIDRLGGRRIIILSGLLTVCGTFLFALAPAYPAVLAGRVLMGIGTACVLMASLKIYGNWFSPHEFATISGFMVAIGNLGNLSATAPLALAVSRFGWRHPFLAVGTLQAVAVALVGFLVSDAPRAGEGPLKEPLYAAPPSHGIIEGWRTVFGNRSFWLLALLAFCWYGNYMVLQGLWGGPYLMDALGLSRAQAGNVLLFTSLGFIAGCLVVGRVSDRLLRSRKWTLLVGQAALLALMTLMLGPAEALSRPLLACAFFAVGVAVSSGVTIYPMIREMFPAGISATAMTALNFFVVIGAAAVQQVMGFVVGRFPRTAGSYPPAAYHQAFLIPILGLACAVALFFFVKDTHPERT
ncbi:MAG TPA: MFS transporter [Geobacteraceae bacterium]